MASSSTSHKQITMETKLYEASLTGDVQALNALLHDDHLILHRPSLTGFNETPLHVAAMRGHLHFATAVLGQNPKLAMAVDSRRRTPLHLASADGNVEMVREILKVGGDDVCGCRDEDGLTPLHLAAMNEHVEVVKALVRANVDGVKENIPVNGETVLHVCVRCSCLESLKVVMEVWSEEEVGKMVDDGGNTLLHAAAINKHIQILKYLLGTPSIKANGNVVNRHGLTALDVLDQSPRDLRALEARAILMEAGVSRAKDLRPVHKPLPSSTNSSETKPKGLISRTRARYLKEDNHWLEKQRGILVLAALVVATMSFQSGIKPPGGTITNIQNGRYELGITTDLENFNQFVMYNTVTMIISLVIVLVLISGVPLKNKFVMWVLMLGTLWTLVFMVLTYYQSLSMMGPDGYVDVTSVWMCLIWMLGCGVVALIHTIFFVVWVVMKLPKCKTMETRRTRNRSGVEV